MYIHDINGIDANEKGLENSRLEVNHPDIHNEVLQTRHELEMCWILFKIVLSVLLRGELRNKSVCEGALRLC